MLKKINGQAMMEAVIAMTLGIATLIICLFLFHGYVRKIWVDHHLYQSLICVAKREEIQNCKKILIQRVKHFLWLGKLKKIQLKGKGNQWKGIVITENIYGRFVFQSYVNLD